MQSKKETIDSHLPTQPDITHRSLLNIKTKLNIEKKVEYQFIKRLIHAVLRESLLPFSLKDHCLYINLPHSRKQLRIEKVTQSKIRTFKMKGDIFVISDQKISPLRSVDTLLALLKTELESQTGNGQWQQFVLEIQNSLRNLKLVNEYSHRYKQNLRNTISQSGEKTLIEYVSNHLSHHEQILFFETWAFKAHPYHPCHKTKLGFTPSDYLKYSSEFDQNLALPLAAVKKDRIHLESENDNFNYNTWFSEIYPKQWASYKNELQKMNFSTDDFYPVFIHPWQYEHVLKKMLTADIANQHLIWMDQVTLDTKPSLSFRTVTSTEEKSQPHIKLPVAIQCTSALRTISAAAVENGPKFSKIFRAILKAENQFDEHFYVMQESYALRIQDADLEVQRNFATIYRDNPTQFVRDHQIPIVVAALFEKSPVTELPLFIELIHTALDHTLSSATEYFSRYCDIILRGYLDLFLIYGIGFEGHQQNTIVVFEDYFPRAVIARDLGGIRIHLPTLQKHGFDINAHPTSATVTVDLHEVTNKFAHTVIQYQLGELVLLLADYYQVDENIFWKIVKDKLHSRFEELKPKMEENQWIQIYKNLLSDDWQIKSLMRMRLNDLYNKNLYASVTNPLLDL